MIITCGSLYGLPKYKIRIFRANRKCIKSFFNNKCNVYRAWTFALYNIVFKFEKIIIIHKR
jgi:hypothetical protein